MNPKITVSDNNIHIEDSYLVSKYEFDTILDSIKADYPNNSVIVNRSRFSLKMEWATHNGCYNMHLFRSHTKDVDLNYPLNFFITFLYCVCGMIFWPFLN